MVTDLKVYPNPFRREATIDFGRVVAESWIRLVDVYGKLIEEYRVKDTDKYIINKGNKADGIYFLEIEIEDKLYNVKLIMD